MPKFPEVEEAISGMILREQDTNVPVEEPGEPGDKGVVKAEEPPKSADAVSDEQYLYLAGELKTLSRVALELAGKIPSSLPPLELLNIRRDVEQYIQRLSGLSGEFGGGAWGK